jgi:hypothetical protein
VTQIRHAGGAFKLYSISILATKTQTLLYAKREDFEHAGDPDPKQYQALTRTLKGTDLDVTCQEAAWLLAKLLDPLAIPRP